MRNVDYYKPKTLAEAMEAKGKMGPAAAFIAGGTDVMVAARQATPDYQALISLRNIAELSGIQVQGDTLHLGATTTLTQILKSDEVAEHLPVLHDAVQVMGSTQMRNMATVGGNIMTAASSGDTLGPLLCLEAVCRLVSPSGERRVPMDQMFSGPRSTAAEPDEILAGLDIPLPTAGGRRSSGAFFKLTRRAAMDLALINVAAQLWVSDDGATIEKARLAAGVVAPTPVRLYETEDYLAGAPVIEAIKEQTASLAVGRECRPRDSDRCSAWYREEMLRVMIPRAAALALSRMGVDLPQAS